MEKALLGEELMLVTVGCSEELTSQALLRSTFISFVALHLASIFRPPPLVVLTVGRDQLDGPFFRLKSFTELALSKWKWRIAQ